MESLHCFKFFLQKNNFLCKINLKDANFSVRLYKESKKYIRYIWLGNLYEFLCLCFGLEPPPSKKKPIVLLRGKTNVKFFFEHHPSDSTKSRGNSDEQRYTCLFSSEFRFWNWYQKVSVQTRPSIGVSWYVNRYKIDWPTFINSAGGPFL